MSTTFFIFVCVGFVLFVLSSNPNSPFALYPHVHTVPSAFKATKWLYPPTIFANVLFSSPVTFIFTAADKLLFSSIIFT